MNTDGTIDGTFSVGTGFNNRVTSIKVQPDGKILVGGFFTNYNGSSRSRIVRLNTNGTIDGTFSIGTGFNNSVNSVSLQSDGKILVGGNFINYNGTGAVRFARLNTGGTIDGTFTTGTGFNNQVYDSVELSDGKILVGGQFTTCDGNTAQCIARLTSTGSFDATFSAATGFTITTGIAVVRSLIEDSDNKYLVGGQFNAYSGQAYNHIVRFETGGTIDTTFISVGEGFEKTTQAFGEPIVYTILELNNGTYLTSGYRLQKFVNPDINVRASHYNIDKNGNVLNISYSREEYKTSVANLLSGVPTFTGNTSGDCITDLYVTNLYGCSPLHIEPSGLNDVYIVENGGNVGIGTTNPQYKLEVNGTFGATSKSFDIPHPTKEGKRLRYGSLEGPEYGVYVRGKLSGENIIELPEYWAGLVDENSITVQLTPHGRKQDLFVGEIINNTVEVLGDDNPECYYMVLGERKDIDRITVEY